MQPITLPAIDNYRGRGPMFPGGELPKTSEAQNHLGRLYEFNTFSAWNGNSSTKGEPIERRPMTPALCRFASEGKTILPKRHIPTLKAESLAIANIVKNIMANSFTTIDRELKAANVERQKLIQEGRIDEAAKLPIVSEEELYARKEIASKEFKKALKRRQNALLPIWAEVGANIGEAALEKHNAMEAEEKARTESLGLTYKPTEIIIALGQLSWRVQDLLPSGDAFSTQLPEDVLKVVGIELK